MQAAAVVSLDAMLALPIVKDWNLMLTVTGKLWELHMELHLSLGFAVSDGSICSDVGTAAWIIEGQNQDHWITVVWTTLGIGADQSTFRSKLWGIYGLLLMVLYLPPASGKPELQLACHREVALHCTFSLYPLDTTESLHANIISAIIQKVVEQCSYTVMATCQRLPRQATHYCSSMGGLAEYQSQPTGMGNNTRGNTWATLIQDSIQFLGVLCR